MFDSIIWGNSLKTWLISLLIIVIAIIVNKGISLLNKHILCKIVSKSKNNIDNILFSTLEKPVLLGVMLLAIWIAVTRLDMSEEARGIIGNIYQILTVLNVTWFFAKLTSGIIDEYSTRPTKKDWNTKLIPLLKRVVLTIIWVIGIVTALNNVGLKVTTLLGTLGVGGVAVALAAQDTIKNIFGGITIFTDNPFQIGDTIKYDSFEGTVLDVGLRSTRIKTYDNRIITIPNFKLMDASIINISLEPNRRVSIKIGLTYNTTPLQMKKAIDLLKAVPAQVNDIEDNTIATFSEFGDSALLITYMYYINKGADIFETISKVNFLILSNFNDSGLEFAYPSQKIYVEHTNQNNALERDVNAIKNSGI